MLENPKKIKNASSAMRKISEIYKKNLNFLKKKFKKP